MRPSDLLLRHYDAWSAATRHPFLVAVRDGTLDVAIFATWLVQDYLFVGDEFACQARLLARVPRNTQKLLIRSLQGLESELSWFELHAKTRNLDLDAEHHSATVAYRDFLQSLEHKSYAVAMTAIWAVERAYLDSWQSALPSTIHYREYIEHWANAEFESFVSELENHVADAFAVGDVDEELEAIFLNVAHLEHGFWEMAWKGGM